MKNENTDQLDPLEEQDLPHDELDFSPGDTQHVQPEPWRNFYSPKANTLTYSAKSTGPMYIALATISLAVGAYIFEVLRIDNEVDAPFVLLFSSLFPLIACYLIVRALIGYYRYRKFGVTRLTIDNLRGILGEEFRATLNFSQEIRPIKEGNIKLTCYRRIDPSTDDNKRTCRYEPLWSDNQKVPPRGTSLRGGLRIVFSIPRHYPESSLQQGHNTIHWILHVHIPTAGLDYRSSFTVPVFLR